MKAILGPEVRNEGDLRRYIITVSGAAVAIALAADIVTQLSFFIDFARCLRSWAFTTIIAGGIAWPIARAIGIAHLDLYQAKQESDRLGRIDPLTGLANRRAFTVAGLSAEPNIVAVAIADINRFTSVNDEFRRLTGEAVIQAIAGMRQRRLGGLGTLARVGGEEFAFECAAGSLDEVEARINCLREGRRGRIDLRSGKERSRDPVRRSCRMRGRVVPGALLRRRQSLVRGEE